MIGTNHAPGRKKSIVLASTLLLVLCAACQTESVDTRADAAPVDTASKVEAPKRAASDGVRLVTLGGRVTETAYALGFGDDIIAVDVSSTHPEAATTLPQVGYQRTLSAENILGMNPSMILATTEAGPPPAIEQMKSSGVNLVVVGSEPTVDGARATISGIATALGAGARGRVLVDSIDAALRRAKTLAKRVTSRPKVLFVYARGAGALQVSGTGTAAAEMIRLAGATNAFDAVDGFKPMTAEAVVAAAPDVILIPSHGLESIGGIDGLLGLPGIAETPAGRNRRIVHMNDLYLLGMGPRLGQAVIDLMRLLHPELAGEAV